VPEKVRDEADRFSKNDLAKIYVIILPNHVRPELERLCDSFGSAASDGLTKYVTTVKKAIKMVDNECKEKKRDSSALYDLAVPLAIAFVNTADWARPDEVSFPARSFAMAVSSLPLMLLALMCAAFVFADGPEPT